MGQPVRAPSELPPEGVARAYHEIVEHYPSWATLAQAPLANFEKSLRPLRLWREKSGTLPIRSGSAGVSFPARTEWERLPGIGPYTVSAVLAIVYGRAEPSQEANMARLLGRLLGTSERAEASPKRTLHGLALRLVSGKRSLEVNWAALDFGALICRARCAYARLIRLQSTPSACALSG